MIVSMTGFGKTEAHLENKTVTMELRSLNSKNADINTRLPSFLKDSDTTFRNQITRALRRGKIDLSIYIEFSSGSSPVSINKTAVQEYIDTLKGFEESKKTDLLAIAMRLPEALHSEKEVLTDAENASIQKVLEQVINQLHEHRIREGIVLEKDFETRLNFLETFLNEAVALAPERIEKVKEKLLNALQELKASPNAERYEQELIYYLEKYDITEEKVRLQNHIQYFREVMQNESPNGKKLGFISQEMGREINTIGSKANHSGIQKKVVEMKDELEKIKEQLLNVL